MTADRPTGPDLETARMLIDIGAVSVDADKPFVFTSGWASPVYVDCRRLISFPAERTRVVEKMNRLTEASPARYDAVAGGETAGIPYAAWLADRSNLPMLYVRKRTKECGRKALIEGYFRPGARILLVEDLATDGKSKMAFCETMRREKAVVFDACVIFFYGIFPNVLAELGAHGINLIFLATWWDVLAILEQQRDRDEHALGVVRQFLSNPVDWSAAHGGRARL